MSSSLIKDVKELREIIDQYERETPLRELKENLRPAISAGLITRLEDVREREIYADLAAIREDRLVDEMFAREQERMDRLRPWSPAEIIWQSEWYQGFGEEAQEFIGLDEGKYYCAFTRSPAEDEEYLSWDGPYDSREAAEEALNQRLERWREIRGEIEDAYQEQQIAEWEKRNARDRELGLQHEIGLGR